MPTIKKLRKKHNSIPSLDLELLLAFAIKKDRAYVLAHPEYKLSVFETIHFAHFRILYTLGYPLAYIGGSKDFFGLTFYVNKHTLIPRPETELLIEEVLNEFKNNDAYSRNKDVYLIDVGTGTGCIPVVVGEKTNQKNIKLLATDISRSALKIAKKNAALHTINVDFFCGNLLETVLKKRPEIRVAPLIITANLPYLTIEQFKNEKSIQREPYLALVAKNGGLAIYDKLLKQIKELVYSEEHIKDVVLFFEIDPSQTLPISKLVKTYFSQASIEIKKDLAGRDRVVKIIF
jgi:release factor glutamine methyltransferase